MPRVIGLGGVFYKTTDPGARAKWYQKHLGLHLGDGFSGVEMRFRRPNEPERQDMSLVAFFEEDTGYLGDAGHPFMLNFVVEDLEGMVEKLKSEGCDVDPNIQRESYGTFAWVTDPDGVRIELWEPTSPAPDLP
ncbi:MAG: VOC family protein [Parvularcula sp.]|jgi:predicted enzyme related to lactoylglutathione lyase|nr:VOC family protein [Parvularcula sp.]